jgi:hypothetical protein
MDRNSKSEIRNTKQYQMFKIQNISPSPGGRELEGGGPLANGHPHLNPLPSRERNFTEEEVLKFEFRYWDLFRI